MLQCLDHCALFIRSIQASSMLWYNVIPVHALITLYVHKWQTKSTHILSIKFSGLCAAFYISQILCSYTNTYLEWCTDIQRCYSYSQILCSYTNTWNDVPTYSVVTNTVRSSIYNIIGQYTGIASSIAGHLFYTRIFMTGLQFFPVTPGLWGYTWKVH